jgi:hypothetical protein
MPRYYFHVRRDQMTVLDHGGIARRYCGRWSGGSTTRASARECRTLERGVRQPQEDRRC